MASRAEGTERTTPSWDEKYNSKGPEWRAPGDGETLQKNPDGQRPVVGGNTFVVVEADGDDLVHSDGKTAAKAVELIGKYATMEKPFWLGLASSGPVPFVAPRKYYDAFKPYSKMVLPEKFPGDWDDIPKAGINYCTSENMQMGPAKAKEGSGRLLCVGGLSRRAGGQGDGCVENRHL